MKTDILIVTQSEGGGLRRHVTDLIDGLDKHKFNITFVFNSQEGDKKFKEWLLVTVDRNQIKLIDLQNFNRAINPISDFKILLKLIKIIKSENPSIVHAHSSKAGIIGRLAAKICGVQKIFYTPHAYSFLSSEFSKKSQFLYKLIERFFSHYMTTKTFNVSNSEKKEAINNKIDIPDKFEVIFNGIPQLPTIRMSDKQLNEFLNIPKDSFIVGNVARIGEQKNPYRFLETAKLVLDNQGRKDIHFVWIGSGHLLDDVNSLAKRLGINKNVHFIGERTDAEILMNDFDIFLVTSNFEGFSYSLLEAARLGIRIVGPNVAGITDLEGIYKNTTLFEIENFNEESAKLICESSDGKLKLHKRATLLYTYEDMISAIEDQYLQATESTKLRKSQ